MRRRLLAWATSFALTLAAYAWWGYGPQIRNEFFIILGNRDEAGGWYGWWSGNAGGLQIFEWMVIGALMYWHHTCHLPGCMRLGKYPAASGMFMLCHRHHPDLGGARPSHEIIHRLHQERT